jgi:hypothetical protein
VGIGFDSYISIIQAKIDDSTKSACYFCSDYIPPSDTQTGRTMD